MSNYNPAGGGLQYRGTAASAPPNCFFNNVDPTPYDKNNVSLLDLWLNKTTNDVFILVSLAGTQTSLGSRATWVKLSTGSVGVFTITGDDGDPVYPDGDGNINIVGALPIVVTGTVGTFTESISVNIATDVTSGVTTLANNMLTIAGLDATHAVTPASLTAKLGTQTINGVAYGAGTAAAINWTAAGTPGQIPIANNAGVPAFGSITSPDASITVGYDNGTNSITLIAVGGGGGGVSTLTGDSGGAVSPTAGNINIFGTNPIMVVGNPGTSTEQISIATATTAQIGATTLATDALTIAGADTTHVVTPASLTAKLGTQTVNGVAFGAGTAAPISWTGAGTSSATIPQILIAHTAGTPEFGSITSTGGTVAISYNDGTNTINLEADDAADVTVVTNDATPTALFTVAIAVNNAITLYADIIGAKSDYSAAIGGNVEATARRAGGALTIVGAPVVNLNEDSAGTPDFNIVVSGNDLIVQVTGEAATTYNWKALIRQALISV